MRIGNIRDPRLFQRLVETLMLAEHGDDYQIVDDSGGDGGLDGFLRSSGELHACYCPEKPESADYARKFKSDLRKAIRLRNERGYPIRKFVFFTPSPMREPLQRELRDLAVNEGFEDGRNASGELLEVLWARHRELEDEFPDLSYPRVLGELRELRRDLRSVEPLAETWKLANVERRSAAARRAINPKRLPRIERYFVSRDYRPAIEAAIRADLPEIFALVGEAGFGKSTLLGQLYDELSTAGGLWVALILCSDVARASSADETVMQLGRTLCGKAVQADRFIREMRELYGPGVVLIDTLDLLLNEESGRDLRDVLSRLADAGSTVVFTCRDWEYDQYLFPTRGPESALAAGIHRRKVPWFEEEEVQRAATLFVQALPAENQPLNAMEFATALLELSADSRSLREIVYHPLRLSLLCELFHDVGAIPPDLTVTELYSRYWAEKVEITRSGKPLGYWKTAVCLTFTEIVYGISQAVLVESVRKEALRSAAPENEEALQELRSEGVLVPAGATDLKFFHQTFLEYVLARWITAPDAPQRLATFVERLDSRRGHPVAHWWPVLRQVLFLCGEVRAREVASCLNLDQIGAYRAAAQAAVAGEYESLLRELLPGARHNLGFRKTFLQALGSPSRRFFGISWELALQLLNESRNLAEATQSADAIGTLLLQTGPVLPRYLDQAVAVVNGLDPDKIRGGRGQEPHSVILGTLVATALPVIERHGDRFALQVLRRAYTMLGEMTRRTVLQLHMAASQADRTELLRTMLSAPTPPSITEALLPLFDAFAPWCQEGEAGELWETWEEALYSELPEGWELVRARSAGQAAVRDPAWLRSLLQDFLYGDKRHLHQNIIALHAAILRGGGDAVSSALVDVDPATITVTTVSGVSTLLRHVARDLEPEPRRRVAEWLLKVSVNRPDHLIPALGSVGQVPVAMSRLLEELDSLPLDQQIRIADKALYSTSSAVAVELVRHVASNPEFSSTKGSADLLVSLDALLAGTGDGAAVERLADVATSAKKQLALSAARALNETAAGGTTIPVATLLRAVRSKVPGARKNVILAIHTQIDRREIAESELIALAQALRVEDDRMVVQSFCELAADWVFRHRRAPAAVGEVVSQFPERLNTTKTFDGGAARAVAWMYRAFAENAALDLVESLGDWTRALIRIMTSAQMDNSQGSMFGLLTILGRRDPVFLKSLLPLLPTLPLRLLRVIVTAIDEVQGRKSALLDEILSMPGCPPEMARVIFGLRGA